MEQALWTEPQSEADGGRQRSSVGQYPTGAKLWDGKGTLAHIS
jgi:hypothetical protein